MEEICEAINAMAVHDENKEKLTKMGCIQHYVAALNQTADLKELRNITRGLWQFSFLPNIKNQLKQIDGLTESESWFTTACISSNF